MSNTTFECTAEADIAKYREEIARLKEQVVGANLQRDKEEEKAKIAVFGKEKLLKVNKCLMEDIKFLKEESLPENQNYKVSLITIMGAELGSQ